MAAAGIPSLSLFPVLRAAVDCRLVVSATDTVFGSGQGLRLFVSSSGASCPVIDSALLQQGLPPHLQLVEGTSAPPSIAATYSIGGHLIGERYPGESFVRLFLSDHVHVRFRAARRGYVRCRWLSG